MTAGHAAIAQTDQGTITGIVSDTTGAAIPNADITLTNTDTGLVLKGKADSSGVYVFSPIKIGNYTLSAGASGFEITTQQNVHLDLQQRLSVNMTLKPGAATETITVTTAPPLMQTQDGSVGQVMSAQTINNVPLNGRNWVYIAQLSAGADPPEGSRGQGKGDFNANGQRAEQNNFILDGVDNNSNVVDFVNGASYVVQPPPDALAEFKVQTSSYSAEFGHSAGAVINASIKSGTNQIHGDMWEYFRNDVLDARNFNALSVPKYRENQFGATLGFPIIKNKLFFFGDVQANRIIFGNTTTESVPTALMREGNFTELLNTSLTGSSQPIYLYQPNSGGSSLLTCNGQQNVFCSSQIDALAQKILNLYPSPNTNGGKTYSNYVVNASDIDNTWQWDTRMDWNISPKDQLFARFSYYHEPGDYTPPLGPILDGGSFGTTGTIINLGENFVGSETHIFSSTLSNEFRFGYNYLHDGYQQPNATTDIAASLGLGGIPYGPDFPLNGGLPNVSIGGLSSFGSTTFYVTDEHENVFQILDNVTKVAGNHSLKAGVSFQSLRFSTLQPPYPRGTYDFTGQYTSDLNASYTGYGVADFLADQNYYAELSNEFKNGDAHWYRAAYFQDDWRAMDKLTLNIGLRYDYYQPYKDVGGYQATYYLTGPSSIGSGSAKYLIPKQQQSYPLVAAFTDLLTSNNISLGYSNNPALINAQKLNFAPRFGVSYSLDPKTVIRTGFGLFYGGLESTGYYPNLGENYPFQFTDTFTAPSCTAGSCQSISDSAYGGVSLENGFSNALAAGLANYISTPALRGSDENVHTPYTMSYNLSVEHSVSSNMVATFSYVGDVSRHLAVFPDPNNPMALQNPANSDQTVRPFPGFGGTAYTNYAGSSNYNSFQTKLEKRMSSGFDFLATYTYAHSLDDAPTPLGSTGDGGYRNTNLLPIIYDYSNSAWDTRQRFTFNTYYELPFGKGRKYLNQNAIADTVIGGWAANLTFQAQTGNPFTVYPNNSGPSGGSTRAIRIGDPFKSGGTPNSTNPDVTCATKTRNLTNWINPCAFANPLPGTDIPVSGTGSLVTGITQVESYLGGRRNDVYGPGYQRVNMSVFKDFHTFREQTFQFRADIFNVFNTPAYGEPSITTINSNLGNITAPRTFQNFTPDARFFQFAAKYQF
ncbi:TonB-dependent receptor [Silvibacterium dinghuense]|uniref:TonB-dependent receptor n=1 Tax=Silvibacterium dinghuense TaxID=1560006 RepID=UPI0027E4E040|nr:carboxypeptidase regulatory-like domain-containing protein [Silvibacterium dinghuense]